MINTPQLSMSIGTMEGEIVDVNVKLNQVMRQRFSRTLLGIISTWVTTSRLDYRLLALHDWRLVTKDFIPS